MCRFGHQQHALSAPLVFFWTTLNNIRYSLHVIFHWSIVSHCCGAKVHNSEPRYAELRGFKWHFKQAAQVCATPFLEATFVSPSWPLCLDVWKWFRGKSDTLQFHMLWLVVVIIWFNPSVRLAIYKVTGRDACDFTSRRSKWENLAKWPHLS